MKTILCVFGTRPEVIKMAPVIRALSQRGQVKVTTCDTGQHRDLCAPVCRWFGISSDYELGLMTRDQSPVQFLARALHALNEVFEATTPDLIVCQGDTTTAMATALAAFHRKIPLAHVEAGLRTGDRHAPWPEEINRRIIDLVADLYFAPTESAAEALKRENVPAASIHVTGNTAIDSLLWTVEKLKSCPQELPSGFPTSSWRPCALVTVHRRESFGSGIQSIARALAILAERFPERDWLMPVHPNPHVGPVLQGVLQHLPNVHFTPPLDYPVFCQCLLRCDIVLTDSGGLQEECPSLGKPVLLLREVTERPEGLEAGSVKLLGCSTERIVEGTTQVLLDPQALAHMSQPRHLYGDGTASTKIATLLEGY